MSHDHQEPEGAQLRLVIRPLRAEDEADIAAALALLNGALGDGVFSAERLHREAAGPSSVLFGAFAERELVGAGGAKVLPADGAGYYAPFGPEATAPFARGPVGSLFAAAVAEGQRGRGIGSRLMAERLDWLRGRGAVSAVGISWVSGEPHTSLPVFLRHGFRRVADVPDFFFASSSRDGWTCDRCGGPCHCTAILFLRDL